jgi:hypothetical protein
MVNTETGFFAYNENNLGGYGLLIFSGSFFCQRSCIGERTPVRKRLETIVPSIWDMCQANAQMFAIIASVTGDNIKPTFTGVPLRRLVETEVGDGKQVTSPAGAWYVKQPVTRFSQDLV